MGLIIPLQTITPGLYSANKKVFIKIKDDRKICPLLMDNAGYGDDK